MRGSWVCFIFLNYSYLLTFRGSDADSDIQVLYEADASNVMQELDSGFSFFIDTSCSDSCEKDSPSTTNGWVILNIIYQ